MKLFVLCLTEDYVMMREGTNQITILAESDFEARQMASSFYYDDELPSDYGDDFDIWTNDVSCEVIEVDIDKPMVVSFNME